MGVGGVGGTGSVGSVGGTGGVGGSGATGGAGDVGGGFDFSSMSDDVVLDMATAPGNAVNNPIRMAAENEYNVRIARNARREEDERMHAEWRRNAGLPPERSEADRMHDEYRESVGLPPEEE